MENLIKEIRNTKGIENIDSLFPGLGSKLNVLCAELETQNNIKKEIIEKHRLAIDTLSKLKKPFRYDDFGQMVVDNGSMNVAGVRGWGWIQKLDNPEKRMDNIGELITELLNTVIK